jgi:hypothetical protein
MACASTVAVVVPSPATSDVLLADFLDHLRAHVLERVLQFDLLRHGHAVLGDGRRAEGPPEDDVAPPRPERHFHGVGEAVDAPENSLPRGIAVDDVFCH